MSDQSKITSESMKQLTEKVMKADLASRKIRKINGLARRYPPMLWIPIVAYVLYHTISPKGRLKSVNVQAGDPLNIWRILFAGHIAPLREIMRPEVYYQERFFKMKQLSIKVEEEVSKDKNLTFKPYIWH